MASRPDPVAGEVTSVVKVEQILSSPSPTSEHLCPPAGNSQTRAAWERLGEARSPGRAGHRGPFGTRREGGKGPPGSAQVSAAVPPPPPPREGPSPSAPRAVEREQPARLPRPQGGPC